MVRRLLGVLVVLVAGCVSTVPIPPKYEGERLLKRDGFLSYCTIYRSNLRMLADGPEPVPCLKLIPPWARDPRSDAVPAGTRFRVLSITDFEGPSSLEHHLFIRLYLSGREVEVYLTSWDMEKDL